MTAGIDPRRFGRAIPTNHAKRRRLQRELERAIRQCSSAAELDGHVHRCGLPTGHRGAHVISGHEVGR